VVTDRYLKAHFSFLEFTSDDQMREYFPCWSATHAHHDESNFCPVEHVFWAVMAFGNDNLALAEDDDEAEAEEATAGRRLYP